MTTHRETYDLKDPEVLNLVIEYIKSCASSIAETLESGPKKLTVNNLKEFDKIETTLNDDVFILWKGNKCGILYKDNILSDTIYDDIRIRDFTALIKENGKRYILNLKTNKKTEVPTTESRIQPNKIIQCSARILPDNVVYIYEGTGSTGKLLNSASGEMSKCFYFISEHSEAGLDFPKYLVVRNKFRGIEIIDKNTLESVYTIEDGGNYRLIDIEYYDGGIFKLKDQKNKFYMISEKSSQNSKESSQESEESSPKFEKSGPKFEKSGPYDSLEIYGNLAKIEESGKTYIIDKNTKKTLFEGEKDDEIKHSYLCGFYIKRGGKYHIINVENGNVSQDGFDEINPIKESRDGIKENKFINNAFIVKKDGKYGVMNNKGEYLIDTKYDSIEMIKDGNHIINTVIMVREKGKYWFYNSFSGDLIGEECDNHIVYNNNIGLIKDGKITIFNLYGDLLKTEIPQFSKILHIDSYKKQLTILMGNGKIMVYDLPHKIYPDNKLSKSEAYFTDGNIIGQYPTLEEYEKWYAKQTYFNTFKEIFEYLITEKNILNEKIENCESYDGDCGDVSYIEVLKDMNFGKLHDYLYTLWSKIGKMTGEIKTFIEVSNIVCENSKGKDNKNSKGKDNKDNKENGEDKENGENTKKYEELQKYLEDFSTIWKNNVMNKIGDTKKCREGISTVIDKLSDIYKEISNIQKYLGIEDREIGYEDISKHFSKSS